MFYNLVLLQETDSYMDIAILLHLTPIAILVLPAEGKEGAQVSAF